MRHTWFRRIYYLTTLFEGGVLGLSVVITGGYGVYKWCRGVEQDDDEEVNERTSLLDNKIMISPLKTSSAENSNVNFNI